MIPASAVASRSERVEPGVPLVPALLSGTVAFLLTYAITWAVKIGDVAEALGFVNLAGVSTPADWQVVGWFFFAVHNVPTRLSGSIGGRTRSQLLGLDVQAWLLVVPILVLLGAGFVVVRYADLRAPGGGALAGAAIAVSYAGLAVVLALVSGWSVQGDAASFSVGVDLLLGVGLAGVGYPVVLGGVGGAVAAAVG